jgi:small subunit ribosomal protein S16
MSVKIRLKRTGRHKDSHFRVVAVDSRKKRDGRVLEYLGHYHPQDDFPNARIDFEKIDKWIETGAQMTDTVRSLVSKLRTSSGKEEK